MMIMMSAVVLVTPVVSSLTLPQTPVCSTRIYSKRVSPALTGLSYLYSLVAARVYSDCVPR